LVLVVVEDTKGGLTRKVATEVLNAARESIILMIRIRQRQLVLPGSVFENLVVTGRMEGRGATGVSTTEVPG